MRKGICFTVVFLFLAIETFSVEIITLEKEIDIGKKLEENGIFVKHMYGFDFDDSYLYLADSKYGTILKVDLYSGKLLQTISSKGQGPGELEEPVQVIEKNNKLYVFDGWNKISIFTKDGKYISSFHTMALFAPTYLFLPPFAVNDKGEIFLAVPDLKENKLVVVYDEKTGKKIRSIINGDFKIEEKPDIQFRRKCFYGIRIDKEGNIYLLYPGQEKIKKFKKNGKLVWEREIVEHELLKRMKKEHGEKIGGVHGFDVTDNGVVFISYSGGYVLDKNGKLFALLEGINTLIRVKNGKIMTTTPFISSSFSFMFKMPDQIKRIL